MIAVGFAATALALMTISRRMEAAKEKKEAEERPISLFRVFMAPTIDGPILKTLHSGYITQGPQVESFEADLRDFFKNPRVLTTNSCTSATHLAFRLLERPNHAHQWPGWKAGVDEVLTSPLTCTATNWPALANGLKLKWVDVNPGTANIDFEDLERKLSPTTKVILFVHWGGTPVDLDKVDAVVESCFKRFGFRPKVIEDCAHAIGAKYRGLKIGGHGHCCVFSLQAIKHVTSGDGGLLLLPDDELYRRGKLLRWFGIDRTRRAGATAKATDFRAEAPIEEWGYKFHMNDINAVIGKENLKHAGELVGKCQRNGAFLNAKLGGGRVPGVEVLAVPEGAESAYWLFTLCLTQRGLVGEFIEFMKTRGVAASQVHTRNDLHPCVADFKPPPGSLPGLDDFADRYACVPVGWWLEQSDLDRIVAGVTAFAKSKA